MRTNNAAPVMPIETGGMSWKPLIMRVFDIAAKWFPNDKAE